MLCDASSSIPSSMSSFSGALEPNSNLEAAPPQSDGQNLSTRPSTKSAAALGIDHVMDASQSTEGAAPRSVPIRLLFRERELELKLS